MNKMTLKVLKSDPNWVEAFGYARNPANPLTRQLIRKIYTLDDVKRVVCAADGDNEGPDWLGIFLMKDGKFLILRAGCDYTGWDCHSGGSAEWLKAQDEAVACLSDEERERLSIKVKKSTKSKVKKPRAATQAGF